MTSRLRAAARQDAENENRTRVNNKATIQARPVQRDALEVIPPSRSNITRRPITTRNVSGLPINGKSTNVTVPPAFKIPSTQPAAPKPKSETVLPPALKKPSTQLAAPKPKSETVRKPPEDVIPEKNEEIEDIDAQDQKNIYLMPEYVQDIYLYLCKYEQKHPIKEKYLTGHQSTPRMRAVLVNWMVDVCSNFKFVQETLHLSVNILDRYLQTAKDVGRDTLQLIGVVAMLIASKYEEICVPNIQDFEYVCDNAYTTKEIFKSEIEMLGGLGFALGKPISLQFLRRYSKIACSDIDHHNLSKYFLEVFLFDYEICHIKPSLQAASSCCLAISILEDKSNPALVWNKKMEYYTNYKYADIKPIIEKLALAFRRMEQSKYQAIKQKYSEAKNGCIGMHHKLNSSKLLEELCKKTAPKN